MLSFKNSILKIEHTTDGKPFGLTYEICLFISFSLYFILYSNRTATTVSLAMTIAATFFITIGKIKSSRFYIPTITIWYLIFFTFAELSAAWAYTPQAAAFSYIKQMIFILVLCFGICQYIDTTVDFERILSIFLLSSLCLFFSEAIAYPWSSMSSGKTFGSIVSGLNANSFSFLMMSAAIIAFYKGYIKNKKLWYFPVLIYIASCFLSGSRKSTVMGLVGILFIILFSFGRPHRFFHFFIALISAALIIWASLKIDFLYEIIGKRFESMLNYYINPGQTKTDSSLLYRAYFINFAKQLFREKPIFGQGFNNFSTILYTESDTNIMYYAHNNYWEILSDLGLVGFIIYYWFYAFLAVKAAIKLIKNKSSYTATLAIALLGTLMIVEWGIVSMSYLFPQIIIAIIFTSVYVDDSSVQKKYRYIQSGKGGRRIA